MKISSQALFYAMVCYGDIFDYPLTVSECYRFSLFSPYHKVRKTFGVSSQKLHKKTYVFLSGRQKIIKTRLLRGRYAKEKWRKATIVAHAIGRIPNVRLVGVTGGLAMANTRRNDDIDLYCVTENGTLWVTRLLVTIFVSLLGVRRMPKTTQVHDKFCLNMFTTVDSMQVPVFEQDLFSAHEVVQMVPLWEKKGTYKQFLHANRWVKTYLPNAWRERNGKWQISNDKLQRSNYVYSIYYLAFIILEPIARALQLWYMNNKRTNEVIEKGIIRFHPHDARVWIKEKLEKKLKKYNIPLDTIFYHR